MLVSTRPKSLLITRYSFLSRGLALTVLKMTGVTQKFAEYSKHMVDNQIGPNPNEVRPLTLHVFNIVS